MLEGHGYKCSNVIHRDYLQTRFRLKRQCQHALVNHAPHGQPVFHKENRAEAGERKAALAQMFFNACFALKMGDPRVLIRRAHRAVDKMLHLRLPGGINQCNPLADLGFCALSEILYGENAIDALDRLCKQRGIIQIEPHQFDSRLEEAARLRLVRVARCGSNPKTASAKVAQGSPALTSGRTGDQNRLSLRIGHKESSPFSCVCAPIRRVWSTRCSVETSYA